MKRRVLIIAATMLLLVAMTASAESFGVGGAFSLNAVGNLPQSAMLSLKVPQLPVLWGIGANVGSDTFNLAVTADWWLYQQNLVSFLGLYVGPGLYLTVPDPFEIGGRIPIGINAYPLDFLEVFVEVAPTLLFFSSNSGVSIPSFGVQGAFGFRFWFNT